MNDRKNDGFRLVLKTFVLYFIEIIVGANAFQNAVKAIQDGYPMKEIATWERPFGKRCGLCRYVAFVTVGKSFDQVA